MTEIERIADALRRTFHGAWYGPSLEPLLAAFTADDAARRPLPHRHSAWEVVLHLTANIDWVRRRLQGEARELSAVEDWPEPAATTADAWRDACDRLRTSQVDLVRLVSALDEARLMEVVPGRSYRVHTMLHGIVGHNAYHAGQLALLSPKERTPRS